MRHYLSRLSKPHLAGRVCTGCGYFHGSGHVVGCKAGYDVTTLRDGAGHWYVIVDRATGRELARNWGPGSRSAAKNAALDTIRAMTAPRAA
jgi:hypothetical protein